MDFYVFLSNRTRYKLMSKYLIILGLCCFPLLSVAETDQLLNEARYHLNHGQYHLALAQLDTAKKLAMTSEQQAQVNGILGLAHYQLRHYDIAESHLKQAIQQVNQQHTDIALWSATLANIENNLGKIDLAQQFYDQAIKLAGSDLDLLISIRLSQLSLFPPEQQLPELIDIHGQIDKLTEPTERAHFLINLGNQAKRLGDSGLQLAYQCLEQALKNAESQPRLNAESLGSLAQLYEEQNRDSEALRLNQQAIVAAQSIQAHDLLLELEWRQGRLLQKQQQITEALTAFQHAVAHIETIRSDIPIEYCNGRSSFRETLEPVYLGLANLLLTKAAQQQSDQEKTPLLRKAREIVESIKQSELEDYLGEHCAIHSSKKALIETMATETAIVYPVLLPDRLEILVSSGNQIRQFSAPVSSAILQNLAKRLTRSLRKGKNDSKDLSRQLHQWLIRPITPWLEQLQIKTLVFVPDGMLRMIPPAALYDGEHYLIEKYAVAISPGLTLFEPTPTDQRALKVLLLGMSKPGSVVDHLPQPFLHTMVDANNQRGLDTDQSTNQQNSANTSDSELKIDQQLRDPSFQQLIKNKLSLPGVAQEINSLSQLVPNSLLMNESFSVTQFKQQALQENYSIVHIASHGVFGKTAETSFLMAYDNVINIDDLEKLLKSEKFSKQPVELITLSACQTAEGDDRAPLGLSGIALKARVRSALGSLWPVSDQAASILMPEFYKALSKPGTSKSQALQQAQLILLRQKTFENPFYWAPFILMGNWL